jgi:DNA uptake protein ComE-like DNA-binding protein
MANEKKWKWFPLIFCALLVCGLTLSGCSKQEAKDNTEKIREKTAEATAEVKEKTTAVVEGVKEGWNRDKTVDLNSATKTQLLTLPGISGPKADLIISRRPYVSKHELVTKKILSESEYDKIADRVVVK